MNDRTLYEAMLEGLAAAGENAPALYYKGKFFSYGKLKRQTDRLACGLARLGVRPGDAVTICMPNTPESVYALYAVNKLGAVAHLVHPLAPPLQLESFMRKAKSVLLITLDINLAEYAPLAAALRFGILSVSPAQSLGLVKRALFSLINRKSIRKGKGIRPYNRLVCKGDVPAGKTSGAAVYLHSGGTSGEPKVIELSAAAVNALVDKAPHILRFMPKLTGTYMLAVLPTFHGFGLAMGIHAPMAHGAVSVLMPKFSTKETIALIEKGRLNYLIGVPVLYEALLRKPEFSGEKLKNVKVAFIGGDSVMPDLIERFDTRMEEAGSEGRMFEGYGLTETVTVCNVNLFGAAKTGSVGKPLPGIEIAVADERGKPLAAGETGEILVAGDTLMDGYLDEAEATAAAFTELNGKRYVRTGDAGYLDADGFLYFKQRLKRIIKIAGVSVYPSEIESVVSAMPGIDEACAVEGRNEKGETVIVLYLAGKERADAEIQDGIRRALGKYAVPRKIVYLDSLPKTLIGKVAVGKLPKA